MPVFVRGQLMSKREQIGRVVIVSRTPAADG